jgi:hypothetical protein
MPEPDLLELFARPLNQSDIRYLISGSVAAMLYGEPRVTHDIDMVVLLRPLDVPKLAQIFPSPTFYVPPVEVIANEMRRERFGHFNVIHAGSGLKADIYLVGSDELHAWALERVRRYTIGADSIVLAPPEYVILRKLEYFREGGSEKHLRDIRAMIKVSGDQLDSQALNQWVDKLALKAEWAMATR